ncbi:MAG: glycosyltransferase family 39 protein [Burkholderiaceae bacterium]
MSSTAPSQGDRARFGSRAVLLALAALAFLVLWFGNLEYRDLVDPDEGRYAEIPREMMVSGDWTTPRLNDLKYFEKPPLQYWATAVLYRVFGVDEWVARLWPALAGLAGLAMTFLVGRRLYGARVGALAALILGGMLHYVVFAHILTLDMTVTLFLAAAVFALVIAQADATQEDSRQWWMLAAWATMAGAVLSKGLIGIVLPAATLAAYMVVQRDFALLRRLHALPGFVLLLVLTVPWFLAVSLRNPEFARFFFWHEHVERFLLPDHHRPGAWWYFLAIAAAGALPWTVLALSGPHAWWRADRDARFQPARFLVLWVVVVTAFFSASSSKLPGYILPIFPALALLMALQVARGSPRTLAVSLGCLAPVVVAASWFLPKAAHLRKQPDFELYFGAFLPWLFSAAAVLAAGLLLAAALAWNRRTMGAVATAGAASLVALTLAITGDEELSPIASTARSGAVLVERLPKEARTAPFFSVSSFGHSLPFILERPVTLVDYRGELALGLDAEPYKGVPTLDDFRKIWIASDDALAVMPRATFERFQAEALPMTVVLEDPVRVFVRRAPPAPAATSP